MSQKIANFGEEFICIMERSDINNIMTTTHDSCNILADLLVAYGVKYAIISPGSRNAPITFALSSRDEIKKYVIVDERSAAFAALGMAQHSNFPVALVCTSGSAVLNYAPAIAEAYYQQLPIIIISADRPHEWIDQNDSQTIRQSHVLSNIVKNSYNIASNNYDEKSRWYNNRIINDALYSAISLPYGPVHLNIELDEPLYNRKPFELSSAKLVKRVKTDINTGFIDEMADKVNSCSKVLVFASMHKASKELSDSLNAISNGNIVVLSEITSNCHGKNIIYNIDRIFSDMTDDDWLRLKPELLITFGGAPVSRLAKTFLRKCNGITHWRIGSEKHLIDTFKNITESVEITPSIFFEYIKLHLNCAGQYNNLWREFINQTNISHSSYVKNAPWSDLKAMDIIMNSIPSNGVNLQLSNGSSIRYADITAMPNEFIGTIHCNRGVSGIDGSTSTTLGASLVCEDATTLLITGDMSFGYDLSGLASQYNSSKLKIIVLRNGGGSIFRFINGPTELPEFEKYFEVKQDIPVNKYAAAFGFDYFEANNEIMLKEQLVLLFDNQAPSILAVNTDNIVSASVLKGYYNKNNNK